MAIYKIFRDVADGSDYLGTMDTSGDVCGALRAWLAAHGYAVDAAAQDGTYSFDDALPPETPEYAELFLADGARLYWAALDGGEK